MHSPLVSAAWHARMTQAEGDDGLCVARGKPVRVLSTFDANEVRGMIEQAHEWSKQGLYVVGGLSYEAAPVFDAALPVCMPHNFPLLEFHAFEPNQVSVLGKSQLQQLPSASKFMPWLDQQTAQRYQETYKQVRQAIEAGEFYQINLTTRLKAANPRLDAWAVFQHLYASQSAPQSFFLRGSVFNAISLSPELFFRWDGNELQTAPMKGTRRPVLGGLDVLSDSEKDRAENVMIVDLLRNDMAKVCQPKSVQVRSLFDVMHLPTVDQMTSSISGRTLPGTTLVDLFEALFPCGSVTGAPKSQAMLRIAQWEQAPRKLYCGALGVLSPGGGVQFNVPIRTVIEQADELEYGVGSGITWYSTASDEKKEWWQKTTFLREATCDFQVLETLRLENGKWIHLDDHLERMEGAAKQFSFLFDEQRVRLNLDAVAHKHTHGVFRARCLLDACGDTRIELHELEQDLTPVLLRLADSAMQGKPEFVLHKTTYRPEYEYFQNQANGAFDVLLFNSQGLLTETCRCNVVLKIDGEWLTPQICESAGTYLLPGVLRARLLRENTIRQTTLNVQDLQRAEEVWLINSLRGWVPVAKVVDAHDKVFFSAN
ncbi:chorismate-binding protein [Limnobacter sp.]|jgi:para-aminobenzoate synthetase / 4-amino-4-deoxychorismate lyase|uniref:chorismate-binding protein n=1 Tax=Limnobacter sp. TaxID=2003368 RepID=UPI0027333B87|nr:chorismate-binding protein [Limnobacter sp.]MDP3272428.1 chorismate-binding protein [Limnobacter sp.]